MQIQRRKNQPPPSDAKPEVTGKSARDQRQKERGHEDRELRAKQFVMHQAFAGDRRGEQKGNLGFGEDQSGAFPRDDPGQQQNDEENDGAHQFVKCQRVRGGG